MMDFATINNWAINQPAMVTLAGLSFCIVSSSHSAFPTILLSTALAAIAHAFWTVPVVAAISTAMAVALYAVYAAWVFSVWNKAFAGHRLNRGEKGCPSNYQLPPIKSLDENKERILENSKFHQNFDSCELLHTVEDMRKVKKENMAFRERAKRTNALTAAQTSLQVENLSNERAKELNMDHIFVPFLDFLWAYTFIGPFSFVLWKRRTIVLQFRKMLFKAGIIKPECDYDELAATLILEQTHSIHYYGRTKVDSELGNIAGFFFADFPYVDENCNFQLAALFAVDIDLDTKRFVKAKLGDDNLTAKETVILLWYNTIAAQHVKLHAMANWGVNLDESLEGVNPFFRRNSVVTVMYNFFGYSTFSKLLETWVGQGLLSEGWAKPSAPLISSFNHGIEENVWQHGQIDQLARYSRLVKFVVKVRSIFLAEFQKHKNLFPGVDGEAMFVGTVLHSLDHTMMDWNLKDALYLDTSDSRFGKMAEMGQVVKCGFVSDVDGLYFHKRFKNSGHPFYDSVYEKAAKIDKLLADQMDTCIIK